MNNVVIKREQDGLFVSIEESNEPVFVEKKRATVFDSDFDANFIAELFGDLVGNYNLETM